MYIVAARDREQRKVLFLKDYGDKKDEAMGQYFELLDKYGHDDPRYEIMYARAQSMDNFLKAYPRYKETK